MFCPNCGQSLDGSPAFCPNCGTPLNRQKPQQEPDYASAAPQDNYGASQNGYASQGGYGTQGNFGSQGSYGAQNYSYSPAPRAPIVNRSIAVCIILSLVTCGIYGIYWLVCLVNDLNTASGDTNATSGGMVFLLTLVTCGIYGLYWLYKAGTQVTVIQQRYSGRSDSSSGILYLILGILGFSIISYALIQSELNKVAAA